MTGEDVTPRTETVLMLLAGFAAVVAFKRLKVLRFAAPFIARGLVNRVLAPQHESRQHAPMQH